MKRLLHGHGPTAGGEYTMCGHACDAFDTGDHDVPIEFAEKGEIITCPDCRAVIAHYKSIRHNREV